MGLQLVFVWLLANSVRGQLEPWAYQLEEFKNSTDGPIGTLTTPYGVPVLAIDADQTLNRPLVQNKHFLETITSLDRERIPERVIHAKGPAAIGYFEVTHDVTNITNVALFSKIGKKTPVVVRFSQGFSERGSPDTVRGALGFAAKFYTEEGNWDFTGLSMDTFFFKDPLFFSSSLHAAARKNPKTMMPDINSFLDFFFLRAESINFLLSFLGYPGLHESFRFTPSFAYHAFQLENDYQNISIIRFSVFPDQGVKYMNQSRATALVGSNPDYFTADLYNAIHTGNYPKWTLGMQVIPYAEVKKVKFDIFDVTIRWRLDKFPIKPIGKIILNKNPDNQFKVSEQFASDPGNLVPGMQVVDKLFEGRLISYRDTQRYRLGTNMDNIEVNRPLSPVFSYNRDGRAPVRDNYGSIPNYYPNSFNGPMPAVNTRTRTKPVTVYTDPRPTNLWQATEYYNSLTKDHQDLIVETSVSLMSRAVTSIQQRGIALFKSVSPKLGAAVKDGLAAVAAKK